jgi:hypothetical protein
MSKTTSTSQDNGTGLVCGVTDDRWIAERARFQNPRIRSFIGCIRLIEEVLDSNDAILHCSRTRLTKIWQQVRFVCQLIRTGIDTAIHKADWSFEVLKKSVINVVERYPEQLDPMELKSGT